MRPDHVPGGGQLRGQVQQDDPGRETGQQPGDERPAVEPARVQAQPDRRQRLQDHHAADQLEIHGELRVDDEDEARRPELDDERGELADP